MTGARRRAAGEAGYSLVEVVVTAGLMSVLMVIFTTAVLQVFRTSGQVENTADARSQLQLAFQRFDRELRYASWIAQPGKVGTAWYVEFASYDGKECLQLRLQTAPPLVKDNDIDGQGVLQLIRWQPGTPAVKTRPNQTIGSQLDTATAPFELQPAGDTIADAVPFTPDFQRLRVRLTAKVGTGVATVDTTFTALNTSRNTPATHTCSEGRPTS
ncbi:type IV pilus modification PilV family protein [Actinoplanes sp. CA-051413]|uniref:type IV pilus modification PilV family protein n=1 Tax=Actinoplanes sp. CA-051413 TaxID=3239899 RepID=UPI003D9A0342